MNDMALTEIVMNLCYSISTVAVLQCSIDQITEYDL